MTFGYNADAAFGNSTADITDHDKELLSSLVDKREEDDVSIRWFWSWVYLGWDTIQELSRPIIFIGHSLGGIVIKRGSPHLIFLIWASLM